MPVDRGVRRRARPWYRDDDRVVGHRVRPRDIGASGRHAVVARGGRGRTRRAYGGGTLDGSYGGTGRGRDESHAPNVHVDIGGYARDNARDGGDSVRED